MPDPESVSRTCPKCGEAKDLAREFFRDRSRPNGRCCYCKTCKLELSVSWGSANRERRQETNATWYAVNKDHARATGDVWRAANRDRVLRTSAAWGAANRERKARSTAAWQKANPEKVAAKAARYRKRHPNRSKAWGAVETAIKRGMLVRQPCEETGCGMTPQRVNGRNRIEAHHHKGYEERYWLDVKWLCGPHHREADARMRS